MISPLFTSETLDLALAIPSLITVVSIISTIVWIAASAVPWKFYGFAIISAASSIIASSASAATAYASAVSSPISLLKLDHARTERVNLRRQGFYRIGFVRGGSIRNCFSIFVNYAIFLEL